MPLKYNTADNELCDNIIHHLTAALHENHFITIGLSQTLNRFIAPKANRLSINPYDHAVIRYMEDSLLDDDPNVYPQQTEKIYIKSDLQLDSTKKKFDHFIDHALKTLKLMNRSFINLNIWY